MTTTDERPTWPCRCVALGCYAGLGPFFFFLRARKEKQFVERHLFQAAALWFFLGLILLAFLAGAGILSYILTHHRDIYQGALHERTLMNFFRRALLVWVVFAGFGAASALFGRVLELPLAGWVARRRKLMAATLVTLALVYGAVTVFVPFAAYTSRAVRSDAGAADAVLLYEDVGRYPRWLFSAAFYPLTRAAQERFGRDRVALRRLTRESLADALKTARFVFIGSHGKAEALLLDGKWFPPEGVAAMEKNPDLRFVYLASCDSGSQADVWRRALAPAEVVTYDRLTAVIEHAWWIWTEGPKRVRALP